MKFRLDGFEVDSAEDEHFVWTRENATMLLDKKTDQVIKNMCWVHVSPGKSAQPIDQDTLTAARAFLDALQLKKDELAHAHQSRIMRESMEDSTLEETMARRMRERHDRRDGGQNDDGEWPERSRGPAPGNR